MIDRIKLPSEVFAKKKTETAGADVTWSGGLFQILAAATAKDLSAVAIRRRPASGFNESQRWRRSKALVRSDVGKALNVTWQVSWCSVMQTVGNCHGQFKIDPFGRSEPMKIDKGLADVISMAQSEGRRRHSWIVEFFFLNRDRLTIYFSGIDQITANSQSVSVAPFQMQ